MTPAEQAQRAIHAAERVCDHGDYWLYGPCEDCETTAIAGALAQARRAGLEEAATYHDGRAGWYEMEWEGGPRHPLAAQWHRRAAAAIRALAKETG